MNPGGGAPGPPGIPRGGGGIPRRPNVRSAVIEKLTALRLGYAYQENQAEVVGIRPVQEAVVAWDLPVLLPRRNL